MPATRRVSQLVGGFRWDAKGMLSRTGDALPLAKEIRSYLRSEVPSVDAEPVDFELKGRLKHAPAEDGWVDVMGIIANNSGSAFTVASFDLSLYDRSGELICVDTISINHLRLGQERAFRSAIRCADYAADKVASWKLQFAGGH